MSLVCLRLPPWASNGAVWGTACALLAPQAPQVAGGSVVSLLAGSHTTCARASCLNSLEACEAHTAPTTGHRKVSGCGGCPYMATVRVTVFGLRLQYGSLVHSLHFRKSLGQLLWDGILVFACLASVPCSSQFRVALRNSKWQVT